MNYKSLFHYWLGFLAAGVAAWGLAEGLGLCTGIVHGPWTFEAMGRLKQTELLTYAAIVTGIPLATVGLQALRRRLVAGPYPTTEVMPATSGPVSLIFFGALIPIVLFLGLPRPMATRTLDLCDDGILVAAANQSSHGKLPYRDIYFHYGPLREIVQTRVAFHLFGTTMEALRRWYWGVEPLGALCVYALAFFLLRRRWLLGGLALVLLGRPDVTISERAIFPLLSLISVVLAERSNQKDRWFFIAAGVFVSLAYFYSMEGGVLTGAAILVYMATQKREGFRKALFFVGGALAVAIPAVLFLLTQGTLAAFVHNALLGGPFLAAVGKPTPPICGPISNFLRHPSVSLVLSSWPLRWWFPVLLYLVALVQSFREQDPKVLDASRLPLRLLGIAGLFQFVMAMGRADYEHWVKGTALLWVLLVWFIDQGIDGIRRAWGDHRSSPVPRGALMGVLIFAVMALARYALLFVDPLSAWERVAHSHPLATPASPLPRMGKVPMTPQDTAMIQQVVERIHKFTLPGQYLYLLSDDCAYYFLADRLNPTRYPVAALIWNERTQEEVIRNLQEHPPACILIQGRPRTPYLQAVADYIAQHYRAADQAAGYIFLVPKL